MGTNLLGSKIKNTYTALVKTNDNSTFQASTVVALSDGAGNTSPLKLSQSKVVSGAVELPTVDGTANQVLVTNGSGVLSFADSVSSGLLTVAESSSTSVTLSTSFMYVFTGSANADWSLPAGSNGLTYRISNATSDYKITLSPNGADTILNSSPFVIRAGATYDFTYISSLTKWIAK
jgi:hypothetical protein